MEEEEAGGSGLAGARDWGCHPARAPARAQRLCPLSHGSLGLLKILLECRAVSWAVGG